MIAFGGPLKGQERQVPGLRTPNVDPIRLGMAREDYADDRLSSRWNVLIRIFQGIIRDSPQSRTRRSKYLFLL